LPWLLPFGEPDGDGAAAAMPEEGVEDVVAASAYTPAPAALSTALALAIQAAAATFETAMFRLLEGVEGWWGSVLAGGRTGWALSAHPVTTPRG